MGDVLALLAAPFAAALVFVGMHTWLGLQVLRRNVLFADLALAQLAALGATLAVVAGHPPGTPAGLAYALAGALSGALLLTASRRLSGRISQEAIIGIVYVLATALTVLVVDRSPQGAEHVKRMLAGSLLTIEPGEVVRIAALYGAIAFLHGVCRRGLLAAAREQPSGTGVSTFGWDLLFYVSFGLVVTSSVAQAGVLLVFSFLVIPAVIGTGLSARIGAALAIGWGAGAVATLAGFAASIGFDLPTGPTMVVAFGATLVVALAARALILGPAPARRAARRQAGAILAAIACLAVLAQSLWLIAVPEADQPLLAALERAGGLGPEPFLTRAERSTFEDAAAVERRNRDEVDRLRAVEREARWKGEGLPEESLRRIASYQQTFNEMSRGERFVQDHLRARARQRARWFLGVPGAALAGLALLALVARQRRRRGRAV